VITVGPVEIAGSSAATRHQPFGSVLRPAHPAHPAHPGTPCTPCTSAHAAHPAPTLRWPD